MMENRKRGINRKYPVINQYSAGFNEKLAFKNGKSVKSNK